MITKSAQRFHAIISLTGLFALCAQLYLTIVNRQLPLMETLIRYFSYFTILTNLLVLIYAATLWLASGSKAGRFFSRQSVAAATVVYIVVVGLIYNTVLRFTWAPRGLQLVVDELLHLVIPLLFVVYWYVNIKKDRLRYRQIWLWLIYPLAYLAYVLLRGIPSAFYPYPFVDVTQAGYAQVMLNSIIITFVFIGISAAVIAIGRWKSR